jgi:hypothetical protein
MLIVSQPNRRVIVTPVLSAEENADDALDSILEAIKGLIERKVCGGWAPACSWPTAPLPWKQTVMHGVQHVKARE